MTSDKPTEATKKQLGYIKKLGYDGEMPKTVKQASIIITILTDGGSPKEAEEYVQKHMTRKKKNGCSIWWLILLIILFVILKMLT